MSDYDLKSISPSATVTDGTTILFGAEGQTGTPQPYTTGGIWTWIVAKITANAAAVKAALSLTSTDVGLGSVKNLTSLFGFKAFVFGRYYMFPGEIAGNSQAATAAGRIAFVPFVLPANVTISALMARVSTGSSGNWKGAIYAADASTLMPTGTPLASGGDASTTTSSTNTDSAFSAGSGSNLPLIAGTLYWRAVNVDNITATMVIYSAAGGGQNPSYVIGSSTAANVLAGGANLETCYFTSAYASAWPDMTSNSVSFGNGNFPIAGFKVA